MANQFCSTSAPRQLEAHAFGWKPNRTPMKSWPVSSIRISCPLPSTSNKRLRTFTVSMSCGRRPSFFLIAPELSGFVSKDTFPEKSSPRSWRWHWAASPLFIKNGRTQKLCTATLLTSTWIRPALLKPCIGLRSVITRKPMITPSWEKSASSLRKSSLTASGRRRRFPGGRRRRQSPLSQCFGSDFFL